MILDIRFNEDIDGNKKSPVQHQGVRLTSLYTKSDGEAQPEIVIHFYDAREPSVYYNLSDVSRISTTND